jgi:hypothetical protein
MESGDEREKFGLVMGKKLGRVSKKKRKKVGKVSREIH